MGRKKSKIPEVISPKFQREVFIADDFDRTKRGYFVSPKIGGKVLVLKLWNYEGLFFDPPLPRPNSDGSHPREVTYDGKTVMRW